MKILISLLLAAFAAQSQTPIVFVHGNGDDASKWMRLQWLFESNGFPRERLYALRLSHPSARNDDSVPQANRSSTVDQASELAAAVTRVLLETGSSKVALVGSSRGGLTIRNYLRFGGGAAAVSHAVLCGTPNHGVFAMPANAGNEFNGQGTFLKRLNAGSELVDGVSFLTIRSDKNDKYAQETPPGTGFAGPALEGANNVVIPNLDHREVAFHPQAFAVMYEFLTGRKPAKLAVDSEAEPVISGLVTGFENAPTNLPAAGIQLRIFELKDGLRGDKPLYETTTKHDGAWGPLKVNPTSHLEFELQHNGLSVRYFRSPFLRSSGVVNLRWLPLPPSGLLTISRPQGYFSSGRDPVTINGEPSSEVPAGLPTRDSFGIKSTSGAPVKIELRGEVVWARPVPDGDKAIHIAEFNQD